MKSECEECEWYIPFFLKIINKPSNEPYGNIQIGHLILPCKISVFPIVPAVIRHCILK